MRRGFGLSVLMRISIIIPVCNEAAVIVGTLERLQRYRKAGHQLILVDGGSGDATVSLATPWVDQLLVCAPGRARQMNHGAQQATGDWLLFLHADTQLPEAMDGLIKHHLQSESTWGRFDLRLSGRHWIFRIVERMINLRSRWTGIATGDQALFVCRDTFEKIGGFASIALMEDIDLSRRLKKMAAPVCISQPVITSSRRWEERGICRTIFQMWWLRLLYFCGVTPEKLVKIYYCADSNSAQNRD